LEIIKEENLLENAESQGKRLLNGLEDLTEKYSSKIHNARGLGLMCAFDCYSPEKRDELKNKLYSKSLILLGCGANTIRFRPSLIINSDEIDEMISIVDNTLKNF
jgi:L-lysine 6-transaminase